LVDIEEVNGKIVITPISVNKEYKLDELLSQCKPESMKLDKEDQEWLGDRPVGVEIW
jgi:antitoxin component of MazEF toxin-antitoxin module